MARRVEPVRAVASLEEQPVRLSQQLREARVAALLGLPTPRSTSQRPSEPAPLDALLVCTGGGGMVAGCALAMEGVSPGTEVWAVEPEGSDDTLRSLQSGVRQENAPGGSGLCDALLSPMPGRMTFAVNKPRLAGGLVVSDAEVLAAVAFAFTHLKLVVEPGGAVALAALLAGKMDARGRTVGAVLSGGNVDAAVFARALAA